MKIALGVLVAFLVSAAAIAAPAPPHGQHPRIALTPTVLATLKPDLKVPTSGAALAVEECKKVNIGPKSQSGYQGLDWASPASSCALAWQLTRKPEYAARGVALWRALLEDVAFMGDKKACVAGTAQPQAIASIRRDSGYAIRFIGLHTALAYDWLHDAPGADEALRKQSRDCFRAWLDWYGTEGYLHEMPGANYHAGFVAAKTLIAVAESGEDGPGGASARFWKETVDTQFGKQIVANGLAGDAGGTPGRDHHGALVGGDWPEGWQYGTLSVIEYALAARALQEQGVTWPEVGAWLDALTARYVYALTPDRKWTHVGGDSGGDTANLSAGPGPFVATLIGPSSAEGAAWAAEMRRQLAFAPDGPSVFLALADARTRKPAAPPGASRPLAYLARGTRTLYARSGWTPDAFWGVFTSPPRLVADHQHVDASNFVFSRGADPLIVDPSPYASRSSLTGNAMTLDTTVVPGDYHPSQTFSSLAELPFARATASGVAAARAEIEGAFKFADYKSDVPLARRDWAFLPEGEVVVIDRALTGGPTRNVYLRFRTPAALTLSTVGGHAVARGTTGKSAVAIHALSLSPAGKPKINKIPQLHGECPGSFGACSAARFDVNEYALTLPGAEVVAVHVIDALGQNEAPAEVATLGAGGAGVVGASVRRANKQTFVVAAAASRASPPATLGYRVPGAQPARHVVFDAPDAGTGRTSVTATAGADGSCAVTLAPTVSALAAGGKVVGARPAVFMVAPASGRCAITEDPDVGPATGLAVAQPATAGKR
jgi:hypothetical protein